MNLRTVSILIIRGHEYLLQHRDDKDYIADPDTYGVFGGSVDTEDSSVLAAALRELKEETGRDFAEKNLQFLGTKELPARTPKNASKMVDYFFYALEVPSNMQIQTLEGQGIREFPFSLNSDEKVNGLAKKAIHMYEART